MNYLSTSEVAALLDINLNSINRQCREGKINGAVKIAGRWLIPKEAVENIAVYPTKKNKRYK